MNCNRDKHNEDIFNYGYCLKCGSRITHNQMIRTTSLKHYKELKRKGISAMLVTKQELNKN